MIVGLKPYIAYSKTNQSWFSELPEHWQVTTLRRCLRPYDGIKIGPFGSQLKLDSMTSSGFKVYGQANVISGNFASGSKFIDRKKFEELRECEVRPGDLTITMMGTNGRCSVIPPTAVEGIMDSHLIRLRVKTDMILPQYAALVIDGAPFVKQQIAMAGKGSIMQGLNSTIIKNLIIAVPPLDEQVAVILFMDWANHRLDHVIRAKRKEIALLNEQKQAIILQAVTRGLDPTVPFKPSGIPWLGDIPCHWSINKFKFLARINSGQVDPRLNKYQNLVLIAPNHIQSGNGRLIHMETADEQGANSGKYLVKQGQVIYSKIRPNLCKATIAPCDCLCSADMYPISPNESELLADYLLMLLLSQPFTKFAVDSSMRVAMPKINRGTLSNCFLWLPDVSEQTQILLFISEKCAPFERLITHLEHEMELLREYRSRLIADVVTGKLDVREAATRLPTETVEPIDTLLEDGEISSDMDIDDEEAQT